MSGLSASGFVRKRLVDIKSSIEDSLKLIWGDNIDLSPQSVFGQFVGVMSDSFSNCWESQENVYNSQYPSTASGTQLSNVAMYSGLTRFAGAPTTATATITGVAGTVIPAGSEASVSGTTNKLHTIMPVTIPSAGFIDVPFVSVIDGAITAEAGTLTVIETPVYGWSSVSNALGADVGRLAETDPELRVRLNNSHHIGGQNLADSLSAQLLALDGVTDAKVFSNSTSASVGGIPAHEFMPVVVGGVASEIGSTIWRNTPAGIQSYGTTTETIIDGQGFEQDTKYAIAQPFNVYTEIEITVDATIFPASGVEDIKAAFVSYAAENFKIDDDVIVNQFYIPLYSIPGILTAPTFFMSISDPPTTFANISIGPSAYAGIFTENISVTVV